MLTLRKKEFHCAKSAIPINHINNDKTVISEVLHFAKKDSKYFAGYKNNKPVTSFYVLLAKLGWYPKISMMLRPCLFCLKMKNHLKKYNEIWSETK